VPLKMKDLLAMRNVSLAFRAASRLLQSRDGSYKPLKIPAMGVGKSLQPLIGSNILLCPESTSWTPRHSPNTTK